MPYTYMDSSKYKSKYTTSSPEFQSKYINSSFQNEIDEILEYGLPEENEIRRNIQKKNLVPLTPITPIVPFEKTYLTLEETIKKQLVGVGLTESLDPFWNKVTSKANNIHRLTIVYFDTAGYRIGEGKTTRSCQMGEDISILQKAINDEIDQQISVKYPENKNYKKEDLVYALIIIFEAEPNPDHSIYSTYLYIPLVFRQMALHIDLEGEFLVNTSEGETSDGNSKEKAPSVSKSKSRVSGMR